MKSFFSSKTIWFGIGQIAFGAIGMLIGQLDHQTAYSLIVTGLGTIGFRLTTSQQIV